MGSLSLLSSLPKKYHVKLECTVEIVHADALISIVEAAGAYTSALKTCVASVVTLEQVGGGSSI